MLSIIATRPVPPYQSVAWIFVSYAFVGVCEGSYGPNMLNIVNGLGNTRFWVVIAMPSGVGCITVVGFALIGFGVPYWYFYVGTVILCVISLILYIFTIYPAVDSYSNSFDLKQFGKELWEVRQWFPKIWFHSLIFIVDMACLSMFNPGCTLYAYQSRVTYRLFGFTTSHDIFILTCNFGSFLGDFMSRRVMDSRKIINPVWYLLMLVFALSMNLVLIPEIAPIASFGFSWANGALYVQSTKLIGELFVGKYHLTATSVWLLLGDAGSTAGSNLIQYVRGHISELKSEMF
jgi:hypothetical protein